MHRLKRNNRRIAMKGKDRDRALMPTERVNVLEDRALLLLL